MLVCWSIANGNIRDSDFVVYRGIRINQILICLEQQAVRRLNRWQENQKIETGHGIRVDILRTIFHNFLGNLFDCRQGNTALSPSITVNESNDSLRSGRGNNTSGWSTGSSSMSSGSRDTFSLPSGCGNSQIGLSWIAGIRAESVCRERSASLPIEPATIVPTGCQAARGCASTCGPVEALSLQPANNSTLSTKNACGKLALILLTTIENLQSKTNLKSQVPIVIWSL